MFPSQQLSDKKDGSLHLDCANNVASEELLLYFRKPGILACTWQRVSYIIRTLVADSLMGFPGQKQRMYVPAFLLLQEEYTLCDSPYEEESIKITAPALSAAFSLMICLHFLSSCYMLAMSTTIMLNPIQESFQRLSKPGGLGTPIAPASNKWFLHF